jgi:hypothetical protein
MADAVVPSAAAKPMQRQSACTSGEREWRPVFWVVGTKEGWLKKRLERPLQARDEC